MGADTPSCPRHSPRWRHRGLHRWGGAEQQAAATGLGRGQAGGV